MSGFKVDFDREDLERQVMKAAEGGVKSLAKRYESMFDSLRRRYTGRPVSEIKPVLRRECARVNGGSINDPQLTDYATLISQGTKIEMRLEMR